MDNVSVYVCPKCVNVGPVVYRSPDWEKNPTCPECGEPMQRMSVSMARWMLENRPEKARDGDSKGKRCVDLDNTSVYWCWNCDYMRLATPEDSIATEEPECPKCDATMRKLSYAEAWYYPKLHIDKLIEDAKKQNAEPKCISCDKPLTQDEKDYYEVRCEECEGKAMDVDEPRDSVNHPSHYNQGDVECIDAIRSAVTGLEGIEAYYAGNVIKYVWRHKHKGGVDDLRKAAFYLERMIALNEH